MSCSQSNYNNILISDVFHTLENDRVQVAPQKMSLCHQFHICTSIKKNTLIPYLLKEATTCTSNHKIAQSLAKFDTLILLTCI